VFLTICFSPDDDPERKLELVLSEQLEASATELKSPPGDSIGKKSDS